MKLSASHVAITTEGGLLPSDYLTELLAPKTTIEGLDPVTYNLAEGERIGEQVTRSWSRLKGRWADFKKSIADKLPGDATTTETRDRWLHPLFQELGFGQRLPIAVPIEADGRAYHVSHGWKHVPIHLVGTHVDIDKRTPGATGAAKSSPHSLVQQVLNASDDHLWGIVSNGLVFRLLRDNVALTRLSFVEWDLAAIFDGDLYSEFFLLWLAAHQSRFDGERPEQCWLERWKKAAEDKGLRALENLYPGVKKAIASLGAGLVAHPANGALRARLRSGELTTQEFYRQVLRVVYRLLFLLVAEDRGLLHPDAESEAALKARRRYLDFYSLSRLRALTLHRAGTPHPDLWNVFQFVADKLGSDAGCPELALPALGSFLWTPARSTPDLVGCQVSNRHFLESIHSLVFVRAGNVRRGVDYKNLGSEELGSVYQGLLEMHPRINADAGTFELEVAAGNERKTTGSYYTPDSLVQCLLDSALEPVIAERLAMAKTPQEKESSLLGLKVCDKAAGSGHFLIRAAHRIARHLARIRSGEEEPSPAAYRTALRDVIGHCIYGVDINPMAVELCKVTLWLEALEPGKPLSFLDHHIRCGNSLLGATPELIAAGIPDGAYDAIEGDDGKACAALKKINKAQRKNVGELFAAEEQALRQKLYQTAAAIDDITDDRPEDIHRKEDAFMRSQRDDAYAKAWDLANFWCAALVIQKRYPASENTTAAPKCKSEPADPTTIQSGLFGGSEIVTAKKSKISNTQVPEYSEPPTGITTQHLRDFVEGRTLPDSMLAEAKKLADQYQFFHWHLAFSEVFKQGGFDVNLGNPPWERVTFSDKEWAAQNYPLLLDAPKAAQRAQMLLELQTSAPALYQKYQKDRRVTDSEKAFLRNSGAYPLTSHGDLNTYAAFAELMLRTVSTKGMTGCIVPSGVAIDQTNRFFFQHISSGRLLMSLYSFENEDLIFPAVHHSTKFCLMTLCGAKSANAVECAYFLRSVEDLGQAGRRYALSPEDIERINPNTKTCATFKWAKDAELSKRLYKRVPVLVQASTTSNPWGVSMSRMLHMSDDSHLFMEAGTLREHGMSLVCNTFQAGECRFLPLYEAKMLHLYDHRFGTYEGQTEAQANQGKLPEFSDQAHEDPSLYVQPYFWVDESVVTDFFVTHKWSHEWVFGWRNITSSVVLRTMIPSIIPRTAVGDPFPLFFTTDSEHGRVPLLQAMFSSFVYDYCVRQKIGGSHLTYTILEQIPALPPLAFDERLPWTDEPAKTWISLRVLELDYTSWDLQPFARDCGYDGPPFRWDADRRFCLRAELDAAFFHLYLGTAEDWANEPASLHESFPSPRDAVAYMMDTFPIVQRKDEAKYNGDFRTKRVILEIYDAMAEAIRTGQPYQTLLDPPPADPRCCHPPKEQCNAN